MGIRTFLSKQYAKLYPLDMFIGVTGSVGKTSTVDAISAVLSQKYKTISSKPGLDPLFNITQTLFKINPSVKKAVLEMGIDRKGAMDYYLSLIKPKTVVVTRIFFADSEFSGNIEEIIEEKGKLLEQLPEDGVAILNYDDIYSHKLAKKTRAEVFYYGRDPKTCLVWAGNIRIENYKTVFELNYGVERVTIEYALLGDHQVYSALAAATLGIISGIPLTKIKKNLENVLPQLHKLVSIQGPNDSVILDDTYNSSPLATEAAIDTMGKISARRRILVLGEMRDLGEYSEKLHRQIAQKIYKDKIDLVLLGLGDTRFIADELKNLGFWEDKIESGLQNQQIINKLLKVLGKGDLCLIKGSRTSKLDEVVKRIEDKN